MCAAIALGVRRHHLALVVVLVIAASPRAHAQSNPDAEQAFLDGKALMEAKQYARACDAFATSDRLEPTIAAKLTLADCQERRGKLATAWGLFLEVVRLVRGDASRHAYLEVATARAAALEGRLPYLTVSVAEASAVEGLTITRNDAPLDPGLWNRALPVDVGTYTIAARAPGVRPWTVTIQIDAEGERQTVDVPRFEPIVGAAISARSLAPGADAAMPAPPSRAVPLAIAGAAVILTGAAIGLELSARAQYDRAVAATDPPRRTDLYDSAVTRRRLATGLGVAALATAGTATWMWWRRRATAPAPVSAQLGPGYLGLAIGGAL